MKNKKKKKKIAPCMVPGAHYPFKNQPFFGSLTYGGTCDYCAKNWNLTRFEFCDRGRDKVE